MNMHHGSFVYDFHSATNTERAQPAKEILMVLREVDVCPLWETPSFTSVVNAWYSKVAKNSSNKLRNNLNTIQQNYSKRRHKVTGCITRLLHKLLGYLSKFAPKIFKSCPKVAHFTKKLLKSCFLSTQKYQFLQLMKVNLCRSIRIIYLFIYSFLLADISIPTEILRLF